MKVLTNGMMGSCHTEHDKGYTNIVSFQCLLDFTEGFYGYNNCTAEANIDEEQLVM